MGSYKLELVKKSRKAPYCRCQSNLFFMLKVVFGASCQSQNVKKLQKVTLTVIPSHEPESTFSLFHLLVQVKKSKSFAQFTNAKVTSKLLMHWQVTLSVTLCHADMKSFSTSLNASKCPDQLTTIIYGYKTNWKCAGVVYYLRSLRETRTRSVFWAPPRPISTRSLFGTLASAALQTISVSKMHHSTK